MVTKTANGGVPVRALQARARLFDPNDKRYIGVLFITPVQLLLILMLVFPFGLEFFVALTEWQPTYGTSIWQAVSSVFSGDTELGLNYYYLVTDEPRFLEALGRTLAISVLSLCLEFVIGLGLATIFLKSFWGKRIWFTALLTPMM
ncbi:MAG: hypothetical protein OXP75_14995, partial [Rhodospirillales bacterium]|nr:hypothetical protein [Rhodospirillales bacterium]